MQAFEQWHLVYSVVWRFQLSHDGCWLIWEISSRESQSRLSSLWISSLHADNYSLILWANCASGSRQWFPTTSVKICSTHFQYQLSFSKDRELIKSTNLVSVFILTKSCCCVIAWWKAKASRGVDAEPTCCCWWICISFNQRSGSRWKTLSNCSWLLFRACRL